MTLNEVGEPLSPFHDTDCRNYCERIVIAVGSVSLLSIHGTCNVLVPPLARHIHGLVDKVLSKVPKLLLNASGAITAHAALSPFSFRMLEQ